MGTDSSGYTSGDSSVPLPIGHVPALRTLIAITIGALAFLLQIKIGTGFPDDLDSSWQQVLAWAITHHVQWGRDLVFTYGPLGFMNPSTAFDPTTYWAVLSLQLVLAGAVALLVITAMRKLPTPCVIVFAAATIILGWSWSTNSGLLIAFPLATMSLERISRAADRSMLSRYAAVTALAAFAATLPLIKFSMFPLWCVWLPLGLLILWRSGRPFLLLAFVLASVLAPVVTWLACGQHLTNFGAWLTSSLQMARYYASAMQSPPPSPLTDWVAFASDETILFSPQGSRSYHFFPSA